VLSVTDLMKYSRLSNHRGPLSYSRLGNCSRVRQYISTLTHFQVEERSISIPSIFYSKRNKLSIRATYKRGEKGAGDI
jgi:hypothetical protein